MTCGGTPGRFGNHRALTPLLPGDSVATGAGSRAEIQLDPSNVLRLAENSEAKIADLSRSRVQLQVARGTVDLAVFQGSQTSAEVDTPNVAVEPGSAGTYRIDVNSNSLSLVTVRDGQAQISTPQGSTTLSQGQQITVEGAQNPQYQIVNARPLDSWDSWNSDRNQVIQNARNYEHVNRNYTGAQDLNRYGRWVYVPNYDWCWTPYVNAGWVPYSYGRWVWEPYYGWTWVSYDRWGWAPYHYGRWFFYGSSWYWWPGVVTPYYYPVWGPAWVSFIGFGYGYYHFSFGFGYGFRSIGWCPLGPRDRFHRWWGRGHSFNIVNYNNY
ncbi:MAG: FecR family protein [Acidobacteriota bacterium]